MVFPLLLLFLCSCFGHRQLLRFIYVFWRFRHTCCKNKRAGTAVPFPFYSCGIPNVMGWSCLLRNRFYTAFQDQNLFCKLAKACHKINSNGSPPLWSTTTKRACKYSHMERVVQCLHSEAHSRLLPQLFPCWQVRVHSQRAGQWALWCFLLVDMEALLPCTERTMVPRPSWNVCRLFALSGPLWVFFS